MSPNPGDAGVRISSGEDAGVGFEVATGVTVGDTAGVGVGVSVGVVS
jgi:hypothetical protein